MKEPIKYGILSTSSIVPRFVRGLNLTSTAEVTAIASRSMEKARAMAEILDIPEYYDSYDAVLTHPDIEAVYIPLINSLHYPYAKQALEAGKHVILEKPFVLHEEEARELEALARGKHLFITEAVKTPFLPVYRKITDIIADKSLGEIRYMDFRQSYTEGPYVRGWNKEKEAGGGVLYANEAYFFHMAEMLGGKVRSVHGEASWGSSEVEEQCLVSAKLDHDILASLFVSNDVLVENGLTIWFEKGKIFIPEFWKARTAYVYRGETLVQTLNCECEYEFQYELAHYNSCIRSGFSFSPVTPAANSARYIGYCEKLYRSFHH